MEIKTKYNLNDDVYPICMGGYQKYIPCEACNDKGEITIKETNKKIRCPECFGSKGHREYCPTKWFIRIDYFGSIGQIRTEIDNNTEKIQYMLSSTGIGSGTLWNENDLFFTTKEAQKECDKRNKNEKENK